MAGKLQIIDIIHWEDNYTYEIQISVLQIKKGKVYALDIRLTRLT